MHLDFANLLNLVSTITLIGALVFTGLQVRAANRARREQAAVTVIETAALSENSARFLELLSEIPEGASAAVIENLDPDTRRQIFLFGLRVEVIGYMVFHGLVDVQTVNDLAGGAILSFWSRAKNWSEERRKRTGHDEFLEWCEWLATQIAQYRATRPMFLLTPGSELAAGRVRPTGGPDWHYEPPSLIFRPARPALQIAKSLTR
jgi:hypothetical protein